MKERKCGICNGSGTCFCAKCGGTGNYFGKDCTKCDGTGIVTCDVCEGTGSYEEE